MSPKRSIIGEAMYQELVDTFMPSELIRDYLKREGSIIKKNLRICELILYSPKPIKLKLEWLARLNSLGLYDDTDTNPITEALREVSHAYKMLTEPNKDTDILVVDFHCPENLQSLLGICSTYEAAISLINSNRKFMAYEDGSDINYTWHCITLMRLDIKSGKYYKLYQYHECQGEICYFKEESYCLNINERLKHDRSRCFFQFNHWRPSYGDFNLQTDLRAGDILEFDFAPYAPKIQAVVLEVDSDNNRHNFPIMLARRRANNKLIVAALKTNFYSKVFDVFEIPLSPIFAVKKISPVKVEDDALKAVAMQVDMSD